MNMNNSFIGNFKINKKNRKCLNYIQNSGNKLKDTVRAN